MTSLTGPLTQSQKALAYLCLPACLPALLNRHHDRHRTHASATPFRRTDRNNTHTHALLSLPPSPSPRCVCVCRSCAEQRSRRALVCLCAMWLSVVPHGPPAGGRGAGGVHQALSGARLPATLIFAFGDSGTFVGGSHEVGEQELVEVHEGGLHEEVEEGGHAETQHQEGRVVYSHQTVVIVVDVSPGEEPDGDDGQVDQVKGIRQPREGQKHRQRQNLVGPGSHVRGATHHDPPQPHRPHRP
mmetsp:Transcript_20787/g.59307  ORF Transcript_20787/g.59307 Transcript_20787/m.59307 type:complete len:243 (-) Transcript_20787:2052-2780(-)